MEFKEMSVEQLETRMAEIKNEIEVDGADLGALEEEVRGIKAELEERAKVEAQKVELRKAVAEGKGKVIEKKEETKIMTNEEIRASKEYVDAYARYLINEDDKECRALLTTQASGSVPVPVLVEDIIKTAWEKNDILSRVKKTNFKGNLKVPFELSADGAYVHTEGTAAPTEESVTFGIVEMIPRNIKKWIRISDEAIAMGGETLVRYIYDELTYQILKKLTALVVTDIASLATSADADEVSGAKIKVAPGLTTVAQAFANLSDEASDIVVVMNKLTYVEFKNAYAAGNFAVDPFEGLPVLFTSALPAYATASEDDVYAFVGDLRGAQLNYPEGEGIVIKYDDTTEAEADLVKIVGRQYVAHAVTTDRAFCNIAKPASGT